MKRVFILLSCFLLYAAKKVSSQSLSLPSTSNWVNAGDIDVPGNQITIEALIYIDQNASLFGDVVSKHTAPSNVNYLLRPLTFELTTYTANGTKFLQMFNPYTLLKNRWYHIAGTYNGSRVRYYVDGCLVVDSAFSGNLYQNDFLTAIGNRSAQANEQFGGKIDEVRIWNVSRSQEEIAANMLNLPNPTAQIGLVAYYKFDGNYINSQGNVNRNGIAVGPISFSPDQATIQQFAITSVQVSNTDCLKSNNGSITAIGNRIGATYSIDGSKYQTANSFNNLKAGNYTLYVRSPEGCVLDSTVAVGNDDRAVSINISTSICEGKNFLGYGSTGIYIDTLRSASGCDSIRKLQLTVSPRPGVAIVKSICEGDSLYGHKISGTYIDTVISLTSCDTIRTLQLTVDPLPKPNLGNVTSICEGDSLLLSPGNFTSYLWQDNSVQNKYVVKKSGVYSVTVKNGCATVNDHITITVSNCLVRVPNVFSPNGDGINDNWRIPFLNSFKQCRLDVYNRYGQLVFHSVGYAKEWDGTSNGKPLPFGTYYYTLNLSNGGSAISGSVTIVR